MSENDSATSRKNAGDSKFVAYSIIKLSKNKKIIAQSVRIASDLDTLKSKLDVPIETKSIDQNSDDKAIHDLTNLGQSVWHFYRQLKSYYEVSNVVQNLPNAFSSSFFENVLLKHAKQNFTRVEKYKGDEIYALRDIDLIYLNRRVKRWNDIGSGFDKLPSSLLLSIVATFDSAFADFTRSLLKARPERYMGSEKSYTVSEILKMGDLGSVIERVIDDEVDLVMNRSHADQVSFFEKSFSISIKDHYERWNCFVEIFERRNLVAHGDLIVNDRYKSNCQLDESDVNFPLGSKLKIDSKYLNSSLDVLIEFGVLLAFTAWHKQAPKEIEASFYTLVEISFSLLTERRPIVASRILEYGLKVAGSKATDEARKMMIVNRAIALKTIDKDSDWKAVLDSTDWSASNLLFQICAAAVRDDIGMVVKLLGPARLAGVLESVQIRDWPAFKWMRQNEEFTNAFECEFGEPLTNASIAEKFAEAPFEVHSD